MMGKISCRFLHWAIWVWVSVFWY